VLAVLKIRQRHFPNRLVETELRPFRLDDSVRPHVGQDEQFERERGDRLSRPERSNELGHLSMRQGWMIAFGKLLRRLEAHRLEIIPPGWILKDRYAVLVAQDDAGAVEDASNRRIELAGDFGLGSPHGAQDSRYVESGDLVNGTIEKRPGIGRTKVALPLISDLRVDGLALRVLDDELGDLSEGRDRPGGFPGGSVGLDGVDAARDELPRLDRFVPSIFEAHCGIGAEPLVLANAVDLVAQNPLLAPSPAHNEMQAVAVAVPARLGRLHSPFGQPRHATSPTSGPTLRSGLSHTAADGGRHSAP
jgi:hypothetical protein